MSRFVASLLQRLAHHSRMRQQRNPLQYSMDRPFFGNLVARWAYTSAGHPLGARHNHVGD